ncbi:MAG TPA: biotin-dependent carboxyltransferase family protein [Jatrophihabitantaceae bacterium]
MIEIVAAGPLTTVQDAGRAGWAALGVPRSGAFDRAAAGLANRLVGNAPDAAVLETTLGGLVVRALGAATVAVTGAPCPGADFGVARTLPAGSTLSLGTPAVGLRSYLAVRGGVVVEAVLDSRSTDLLSGLGPLPLRAGDRLPVGPAPCNLPSGAIAAVRMPSGPFRFAAAPRADWFTPAALALLTDSVWTVRSDSDRIGVRLDGPPLPRSRDDELPSEPVLPGALQVPPDGRPILLGPDAPVTGGYPVIGVVAEADLDRAAQVRPGDTITFRSGSGSG